MDLHGKNIIGNCESASGNASFMAVAPDGSKALTPSFCIATEAEVAQAASLAAQTAEAYAKVSSEQRAAFLRTIADEIEGLGDDIVQRCMQETSLPQARLAGERTRTCMQLRMFADLIDEGSWVDARIELAIPDRQPLPKPDLRRMLIPIGPVAVFCASNFPLAFSVAGGDTASALAAGNPVVVNAHPSHPGTAELVGRAIASATERCDMPAGVFALLQGDGREVGIHLVRHPAIQAVGFTGSLRGGRALCNAAAARPNPIPVYAEMGSINPVFLLPGALQDRTEELAAGLHTSITLGAGQFCTNPGLIVGVAGAELDRMVDMLNSRMAESDAGIMLNRDICQAYDRGIAAHSGVAGVRRLSDVRTVVDAESNRVSAVVLAVDARTFLGTPRLHEEVFGPSTLVVACASEAEVLEVAESLDGQLTASIHGLDGEVQQHAALVRTLSKRAGRVVFDGYPTGVEVCAAMQHGGPYPASSDVRATSVGTAAIERFARPVCFQEAPQSVLPVELQDENPRRIWRMIDGRRTRDATPASR